MKNILVLLLTTMMMATLLSFGAEDGIPEERPKKIEGYGGYKFGMTMEQASAVREDARWEERDYGGKKEKVLTRTTKIFGLEGEITVGFNEYKLVDRVVIIFDRLDGGCNEKLLKTIFDGLVDVYGGKYLKSMERQGFPQIKWQFPQGGMITLTNMCVWRDEADSKSDRPKGLIIVNYATSEGF